MYKQNIIVMYKCLSLSINDCNMNYVNISLFFIDIEFIAAHKQTYICVYLIHRTHH